MADTRVAGAAEPGLLSSDASLWVRAGDAELSFRIDMDFQAVAWSARDFDHAPTLAVPIGLQAAFGSWQLLVALSPPVLGGSTALKTDLSYALHDVIEVSAEASGPIGDITSPAFALWLHAQLAPSVTTSCGGGRELRPGVAALADAPELMLLCLASFAGS